MKRKETCWNFKLYVVFCLLTFIFTMQFSIAQTGPNKLSVVVGTPFQQLPSTGPKKISIIAAPEETIPAVFGVKYSGNLSNVRVSVASDLKGPGTIERLNCEISKIIDDELVNQVSSSSGAVFTSVDITDQPTIIWLTVSVPKRTPPGLYKGFVGFYYQNKLYDSVPIELNVRPMRLLGSSKQYLLYSSFTPTSDAIGEDGLDYNYAGFLGAFKTIGFSNASVNAPTTEIGCAFRSYAHTGLRSPILIAKYAFDPQIPTFDEIVLIENARKAAGIESALYFCVDNPNTDEQIETAINQLNILKQLRIKTGARVSSSESLAKIQYLLNAISYSIDMDYIRSLLDGTGNRESSAWQYYWWDARNSVDDNRRYAGLALWKSGLDGCMPVWMPKEGQNSMIDGVRSLKTEAIRAGIDDTRYITSYMRVLREVKDLKRDIDNQLIEESEAYLKKYLSGDMTKLTHSQMNEFRERMADYVIKFEARLK
ncbi:MAG: hypothetical protein SNJ70_04670 [Armatimonadota bacterium]